MASELHENSFVTQSKSLNDNSHENLGDSDSGINNLEGNYSLPKDYMNKINKKYKMPNDFNSKEENWSVENSATTERYKKHNLNGTEKKRITYEGMYSSNLPKPLANKKVESSKGLSKYNKSMGSYKNNKQNISQQKKYSPNKISQKKLIQKQEGINKRKFDNSNQNVVNRFSLEGKTKMGQNEVDSEPKTPLHGIK